MIYRIVLAAWLTLLLAVVGQQSRAQFNGCSAGFCSRVAGGGAPATTWDAATKDADASISNFNLDVSNNSGNATYAGARTTTGKTSAAGKLYIEGKFTLLAAAFANEIGLTDGVSFVYDKPQSGSSAGVGGGIFTYNNTKLFASDAVQGDVISMPVDFTNGSAWFGLNGSYSGTQNPVLGLNPDFSWTPTVTLIYFQIKMFGASGNQTWTLQATSGSQSFSPPTGFMAWN